MHMSLQVHHVADARVREKQPSRGFNFLKPTRKQRELLARIEAKTPRSSAMSKPEKNVEAPCVAIDDLSSLYQDDDYPGQTSLSN